MKSRLVGSLVGIGLALASSSAIAAPNYTVLFLNTGGAAGGSARAFDGSEIAGYGLTPDHALLWPSAMSTPIDLHPTNGSFTVTEIDGAAGGWQVGSGFVGTTAHALLWHGTSDSVVDLNPDGAELSNGRGIGGDQQVGFARFPVSTSTEDHAVLWTGAAQSAIDLNPHGFISSYANATDGVHQVGFGYLPHDVGGYHALLWAGSSASPVDLNPAWAQVSSAWGIQGDEIVGDVDGLAGYWSGPNHEWHDLSPGNRAVALAGTYQVGNSGSHAFLWQGTSESAINLHQFLPPSYVASTAWAVDSNGNVLGDARTSDSLWQPVIWVVPEPGTSALMGASWAPLLLRRRRRL